MNLRFWHRARPSPEAQKAVQEATKIKQKSDEQARRWDDRLESNGFAEMVEALMAQASHKGNHS